MKSNKWTRCFKRANSQREKERERNTCLFVSTKCVNKIWKKHNVTKLKYVCENTLHIYIRRIKKKNGFVALAKFSLQKLYLLNPVFFICFKNEKNYRLVFLCIFAICIPQPNRIMFDAHGIIKLKSLCVWFFFRWSHISLSCVLYGFYTNSQKCDMIIYLYTEANRIHQNQITERKLLDLKSIWKIRISILFALCIYFAMRIACKSSFKDVSTDFWCFHFKMTV